MSPSAHPKGHADDCSRAQLVTSLVAKPGAVSEQGGGVGTYGRYFSEPEALRTPVVQISWY